MNTEKYSTILKIQKIKNSIKYIGILEKYKIYKRSEVIIKENENVLKILINAKDLNALKASTNGILREIQLIQKIQNLKKAKNIK